MPLTKLFNLSVNGIDLTNYYTKTDVDNAIDEASSQLADYATIANVSYYVNGTTGNNGNDGLTTATPFKTIQYAIDKLPRIINHRVNIYVSTGNYLETVEIKGIIGKGDNLTLTRVDAGSNVTISNIIVKNCSVRIDINHITTNSTAVPGFAVTNCSYCRLYQCTSTSTVYRGC